MTRSPCTLVLVALLTVLLHCTAAQATDDSPNTSPPKLKEGWSEAHLSAFTAGCMLALVEPSRQDYYAQAAKRGDASPQPFPATEVAASARQACSCLGLRVAQAVDLKDFAKNPEQVQKPFIEEAVRGGRCKVDGTLGDIMSGGKK